MREMMAARKIKQPGSTRLRRITITRIASGKWEVVRERDENGETIGCRTLEECFSAVRCIYNADGNLTEEKK